MKVKNCLKRSKPYVLAMSLLISLLMSWAIPAVAAPGESGTVLKDWQLSRVYKAEFFKFSIVRYPRFFQVFNAAFEPVKTESTGMVKIADHRQQVPGMQSAIFARTVFRSDKKQDVNLSIDYHGEIAVFLNGQKVFFRPPAQDAPGEKKTGKEKLHDDVPLKLVNGLNEIFLIVKQDSSHRWGFICRTDVKLLPPVTRHNEATPEWKTKNVQVTPESALYDSKRNILYVTSMAGPFRMNETDEKNFTGFISKIKPNGEIDTLKWVTNLHAPCGMCILKDKLYTIERRTLAEIDINTGKILNRYPIPGKFFMNDISVDAAGNIYISDTSPASTIPSPIYRFKDGKVEEWLKSKEITRANGLFVHQNELLVGCTGDCSLKAVNLETKKIRTIAYLGAGVVDGIRVDNKGNYLVSKWEGNVFRISPKGETTEIINTLPLKINTADFEFIKSKNLLVIPTFTGNKTVAYKIK